MPIYEFTCEHGHKTDRRYAIDKRPTDTVCCVCGQVAKRALGPRSTGIVMK